MKKFVKIISVFMCALLLVTGFFFVPKNMNSFMLLTHAATTQAETGQTFNYNAELVQDNSSLGNFAIDNVEYLKVNGAPLIHFRVTGRSFAITLLTNNPYWVDMSGFVLNTIQGNNPNYTNFAVTTNNFTYLTLTDSTIYDIPINGQTYYLQTLNLLSPNSSVYFDLYFSFYELQINSDLSVTPVTTGTTSYQNHLIQNNFNSLIDMSSSTNYSFTINDIFGDSVSLMSYLSRIYTGNNPYYSSVGGYVNLNSYNSKVIGQGGSSNDNYLSANHYSFYSFNLSAFQSELTVINKNFDYYFDNFYFYIKKPSYRVDNTFFIYNFSYDESLYSFDSLVYQLRKDNNYYNVTYDGAVPNSKYLAFNCDDINNIIFDEYIFVDFYFSNNKFNPYDYGFSDDNQSFTYSLGFDMNFVYYTEPLITSNGSYNYSFDKPDYVSAPIVFKIAPPKLELPIMAWVQNIFIFLLFYCPIISDIIELLHFDKFMAGLLNIFNMFIDSQVGNFVLGCFAFLILWSILKNLLPSVVTSVRSRFSSETDESMKSYYQQQSDNFMKALNYRSGRARPFKWKYSNFNRAQNLKTTYKAFKGKRNSKLRSSFVRMEKSRLQQKGKIRKE